MYRLFIDEVGHHNLKAASDPSEHYLGLTGVIMGLHYANDTFTTLLNTLKLETFNTESVVLHRREILNAKPAPFDVLKDAKCRRRFDDALLTLIDNAEFTAITVVIDKKEHSDRYKVWQHHPYHYCLTTMLERYVLWLRDRQAVGDVLVESRGKTDNIKLEKAYRFIYEQGTPNVSPIVMRRVLSSKELKLRTKSANVAGLQLADLIANPAWRYLICKAREVPMTASFGSRVVEILYRTKYRRRGDGKIEGWGTKMLP